MAVSGERAYALLEKICFIRCMGTPEEKKTAQLICDEAASFGAKARIEEFSVDFARVNKCVMKVVAPYKKDIRVAAFKPCGNTPKGKFVEADVIYTDLICRENVGQFAGKAVMANDITVSNAQMAEAGIACAIMVDGKCNEEKTDLGEFMIRDKEGRGKLPMLMVGAKDALEMVKKNARISFAVETEPETVTSQNVIVDIPGRSLKDDVITFGAHYDSVLEGVGAADNGGGSVILMELLRSFMLSSPEQSLRFIWFGGEEQGLYGSRNYLRMHRDELDDCRLMINVDVAGSIMGHNFVRVSGEESVANFIRFLADEVGYPGDIKQGLMGSDSTPFAKEGIPAVGFGRGEAQCMQFAHSRFDTPEYCCPKALEDTAAFVELFARRVMNAKFFPIPQTIPENIVKRVDDMMSGYDETDKAEGIGQTVMEKTEETVRKAAGKAAKAAAATIEKAKKAKAK